MVKIKLWYLIVGSNDQTIQLSKEISLQSVPRAGETLATNAGFARPVDDVWHEERSALVSVSLKPVDFNKGIDILPALPGIIFGNLSIFPP